MFINSLPAGSVKDFEDIYSFVYKNGRDLSGFIDGKDYTSRVARKSVFVFFFTRSDSNWAVQPQKIVRGLKFCI